MIDKLGKMLEAWIESVTASISDGRQRDYYRGYEDGFNDCREPILDITPEDVERARMSANTYIESEDEYTVRWLRSLVLKEVLRDSPEESRE